MLDPSSPLGSTRGLEHLLYPPHAAAELLADGVHTKSFAAKFKDGGIAGAPGPRPAELLALGLRAREAGSDAFQQHRTLEFREDT